MRFSFIKPLFFAVVALFFSVVVSAQINPSTVYTQNFNALSGGLPAGWTVRTGATATNLGTLATPTLSAVAWSATGGGFSNVCSGNSPATSAYTATDQNNSTDRALSVRQTGTVGDPGAAFVLQLSNTSNFTNFQLNFNLMQLDPTTASGRTTTWRVDYGIGAAPTTFTAVTTVPASLTTTLNNWTVIPVSVNFGNALDNQASNVWIRVVAINPTSGSGSRPRTAIDDVVLTSTNVNCTTPPTISASSSASFKCGTDSVTLSATGGLSYSWNPGSLTGSSVNVSPASTTVYTVTGTDVLGCTNTATVQVVSYPGFSLSAYATTANVCSGGTSILNATDTLLGVKAIPIGSCFSNLHSGSGNCISNVSFAAINATTSSSCSLPSYSGDTLTAATRVLTGSTYTLSTTLSPFGYAGAWLDVNRNGLFETSEYYNLVTNGFSGSATITIPANASLGYALLRVRSANAIIGSADACTNFASGETEDYVVHIVKLSPTAINSYTWTAPAGATLSSTSGNTVNAINVNNSGIYTVAASDANGCTKSTTVSLTVGPLICTGITTSGNNTFMCAGSLKQLTANAIQGGGNYNYQWSSSAGVIGSTKSIFVSPVVNTTYTVIVSDACSPSNACLQTVSINMLNGPQINNVSQTPSGVICSSGTVQLKASATQGAAPSGTIATYAWSPAAGLNVTNDSVVTCTPSVTTVYTVTVSDVNGCSVTASKTVQFSPYFQVAAQASPSSIGLCGGTSTLTLLDTVNGTQVLPGGYCASSPTNATFEDIVGFTFGSINNNTSPASGNLGCGSGVLGRYSDFTACISPVTLLSNSVNPFSLILGTTGSGAANGSKIFIDFNRDGDFVDADEQVYVTTSVVNGNHTEVGNIVVPANVTPGLTRLRISYYATTAANIPGISPCATSFATGEVEDYAVNLVAVPSLPLFAVSWTDTSASATLSTNSGSVTLASPTVNTTYTVSAMNTLGCTATASVSITLGPISCSPVTASTSTICAGANTSLTAHPNLGTTPYHYQWLGSGAQNGIDTNSTFVASPISTTVYTVIVTDNCNSSCSSTFQVFVNPQPDLSIAHTIPANKAICVSGSDTIYATSIAVPNSTNITWLPTLGLNTSSNDTVFASPSATTVYTAVITDANSCTNTASVVVKVSPAYNVGLSASSLYSSGCVADTLIADTSGNIVFNTLNTQVGSTGYTGTASVGGITFTVQNNSGSDIYLTSLANYFISSGIANFNLYKSTLSSNLSGPAGNIATNSSWTLVASNNNLNVLSAQQNVLFSNSNGIDYIANGQSVRYYLESPNLNIASSTGTPSPNIFSSNGINLLVGNYAINSLGVGYTGAIATVNSTSNRYFTGALTFKRNQLVYPITNYAWTSTPTATFNYLSVDSSVVSTLVPATTAYTVTATNVVGCTATNSLTIINAPLQFSSVSGDTLVCSGAVDTLTLSINGGAQPYSVNILPGSGALINDSTYSVVVNANSVYTIVVTDACGASASQTYAVNVLSSPAITITSSNPSGINCLPATDTLSASCATCLSLQWAPNPILPNNTASQVYVSPSSTTSYVVSGVDANGCSATQSFLIQVANVHQINIVAVDTFACNGESLSFSVTDTVTITGSQYENVSYCSSAPTATSGQEIVGFQLASINNSTTPATGNLGCGTGLISRYSDFTTCITAPTLVQGQSYPFSVNIGTTAASLNAVKIFIDFNKDGDFFDASEEVYVSAASALGAHTELGTILIPSGVANGVMRMRVSNFQTTVPANLSSCGTNGSSSNGEVEDYLINIITVQANNAGTYTWQNAASFVNNNGMLVTTLPLQSSSIFTLSATDNLGCTVKDSIAVVVNPAINTSASGTNVTCNGNINGSAQVVVSGGTSPYTYSWTGTGVIGAATTSTLTNIGAGTYFSEVTDANGCKAFDTVIISQPAAITVNLSTTNALCYGSGNATAYVSGINGGTAPYSYLWFQDPINSVVWTDVSASGDTAYNLAGDTCYYLFVQDANGCFLDFNQYPTLYTSICTNQPASPVVIDSITVTSPVLCYGGNSAAITVAASGGTAGYQYSVNGGAYASSNVLSGLSAGSFAICVKDANGCITCDTANITQPSALVVNGIVINHNLCYNDASASASASASGGTAPYNFSWNSGFDLDSLISGVVAGVYTVQVTDNNSCTQVTTISLTQPNALQVQDSIVSAVLCNGGLATIEVFANGGTASYSGTGIQQLAAGTYTFVVSDANACSVTHVTSITEPTALLISDSVVSPILCNGGNAGIELYASGATPTYSGVGIQQLSAGTYTFVLSDANACSMTHVVSVTEPSPLVVTHTVVSPILCNGGSANIDITASGATSPYSGTGLINVLAGIFTVVVNDANACSTIYTATITEPSPVSVTISPNAAAYVSGDTLILSASSVPSTSMQWTGPSTNTSGSILQINNLTTLNNGSYTVLATDVNNCTGSASYTLNVAARVKLLAKVFLSGPFNTATLKMSDALRVANLIPSTEPYSTAPYAGSFVHVNGGGGEVVAPFVLSDTGNNAIVDWVFLELRNASDSTQVVATKSALLQRDGDIVSATDGNGSVLFKNTPAGSYFVAVRHRNHLGIMSKQAVNLNEFSSLIDFTSLSTPLYRRTTFNNNFAYTTSQDSCTRILGGKRALYAGNANLSLTGSPNASKYFRYNGVNNDRISILSLAGPNVISGYFKEDLNLSADVKYNGVNNDRLILLQNVGSNTSNTVYEQLPY